MVDVELEHLRCFSVRQLMAGYDSSSLHSLMGQMSSRYR
jgi:hypothetical protein